MSFMAAREHGSKTGSGFISAEQGAVDRRERLRRLALETIDLSKDPYFMKNHLGQYECRLCLTLHKNEGNYLAHTQGKRHQQNLAKRAAREAAEKAVAPAPQRRIAVRKSVKIGRPGYRVTKQFDPESKTRSLLFQIDFPEIEEGERPRHRFMSAIEQKKETTDWRYQYLLFAAEPYETVCFKVPNWEVDKGSSGGGPGNKFFNHWDPDGKVYSLQVPFKAGGQRATLAPPPPPQSLGGGHPGMMMHPGGRGTGANSMMMMPPPLGMIRGAGVGGGGGRGIGMPPPPPPRPQM
ncbi:hypothetical protein Ndes2437B_g02176 [Nannochloris sp. 'desiccata']